MKVLEIKKYLERENNSSLTSTYFLVDGKRYCIHCMKPPAIVQKTVERDSEEFFMQNTIYPTVGYVCNCEAAIHEVAENIAAKLVNDQLFYNSPLEKVKAEEYSIPKEFYLKAIEKVEPSSLPLYGNESARFSIPEIIRPADIDLDEFKESIQMDLALALHSNEDYYKDNAIKHLSALVDIKFDKFVKEKREKIELEMKALDDLKVKFTDCYPKRKTWE